MRSQPLPSGDAKRLAVREMFDTIAPRYDLVNRIMTFGLDRRWRSHTIDLLALPLGSVVGDVACGTGDFARELRGRGYPSVGLDLSLGMLRSARPGEAPLVCADAVSMPLRPGHLAGVVSGFALRNFADLPRVFAELARVLEPGGRVALLEMSTPRSVVVRVGSRLWTRAGVPALGALLSDAAAYRYLPRSVAYLPAPAALEAMLRQAGFGGVRRHALSGGIVQVVTATRAADPPAAGRAASDVALGDQVPASAVGGGR